MIIFKLINNNDLKYNFIINNRKIIYVLVFIINKLTFYKFILKFKVLFMFKNIINDFK